MPRIVEMKLVGAIQIFVVAALIMGTYFSVRRELTLNANLARKEMDIQDRKIDELSRSVQAQRQQMYDFCIQYDIDMDRYFRDHVEGKKHPWVCSPENKR